MGTSHATTHDDAASAFEHAFSESDRAELLQEDTEAWEGVTGLLLTIVTIGVAFFALVIGVITLQLI